MKKFALISLSFCMNLAAAAQQITGLSGWNIVLDPGHSKRENMGVSGYSEAEKNVRVAWALRDLLLKTTDIDTVYLTREDDYANVSLSSRSQYANALGADWFHSIHSNATGSGGASEINAALLLWGQMPDHSDRPPAGGKAMSDIMIVKLSRGMRIPSEGSRGDCYFYNTGWCPYLSVTRNTLMPAELSEAGYHTNPAQNMRQMSAAFNKLEAYTFYWSILEYHGIPMPANPILTGIVTDRERKLPINGATISAGGRSYTTDSFESLFHQYSNDPEALRNGFYLIDGLPSGPVERIASAPEYYPDTLRITPADTFFTFADVQLVWKRPPAILVSNPAEGSARHPAWGILSLTFNRPVDRASVEAAFQIAPPAAGTFSWANNDQRLLFKPDTLAYDTEYTITLVAEAQDRYGHHLDGNGDTIPGDDYRLHFRTGPSDMTPPQILAVFPTTSTPAIDTRPILNITWNEVIDSLSVQPEMFTLQKSGSTASVPVTCVHHVLKDKSILCFTPATDLEPGQSYALIMAPGMRDKLGNEITTVKTYRFKTGTAYWRTRSIDDFESGIPNWWAPVTSGTTTGILVDSTRAFAASDVVNPLTSSTLSLGVDYGWNTGVSAWLLREYLNSGAPKSVTFDKNQRLQVYLFGDNGGSRFRFAVDDHLPAIGSAYHEVSPWYTVDWYGWRLISWDMSSEACGSWLGDGQLDGILGFDSIQLDYQPGGQTSGTLHFDDLRIAEYYGVGVDENVVLAPSIFTLQQNYPNPFNPATTIRYELPAGLHEVELCIFDIMGRQVRTLIKGREQGGSHGVEWDGRDDTGNTVSSGIYLYKITTPTFHAARRMVFIR
ncbi:MAG TPA: Ig-like domain-containing protein [bacterium]|nr:Ig-like domain-containing protein [bacterium]HQJ66037.1 Ig-like domain-containing protein [bacterium]